MAVFKCKMCGGDLEVIEGSATCECEYCGSLQTLPSLDNEKKLNLFNRATRLRFNNEFDKSEAVYESIVAEFPEEAEAYWGLCLCKYGIEYVDDPATAKKIPTCHRTSYDSIFNDSNFEMALEYADMVAQRVYREEAKEIDRLQKAILEIAQKEEPYDIFICYKETAEDGQRTKDSVLAQDMYDALTAKGYKVFFARITLEDKLGQEYEPYIFSALNSAKIMLAVGTKYEYYNAVWVKNEWSRFLDMMKKNKEKILIPCYADIDAYDMPQEFKNLQGQDMGKIGFMQDLVRGVEKIIPIEKADKAHQQVVQQVITGSITNIENLLMRGNLALEDQKWGDADKFFDRVLDENAEEARAYLGKLMAEFKISSESELANVCALFDENPNFKKICRFASDELKERITNYSIQANYNYACMLMKKATVVKEYDNVIKLLNKNSEYKDSLAKIEECTKHIEEIKCELIYKNATELLNSNDIEKVKDAQNKFKSIIDWKDSKELANKCAVRIILFDREKEERIKFAATNRCHAIAAADYHSIGLKSDGTVIVAGDIDEEYTCYKKWTNIVSVSTGGGHIVGLKSDGTVVADGNNSDHRCNTRNWGNIVSVSAGGFHTVGLTENGTVVAVGDNEEGQCNVSKWSDIIAIATGDCHTVGLKSDGTVVAVGDNKFNECDVSAWRNIKAVFAGGYSTIGLNADGTLVFTRNANDAEYMQELCKWKNIIRIAVGIDFVIGLKSDGTLISTGRNDHGQCDVYDCYNVIDIAVGDAHTIYENSDRFAYGVGFNGMKQCRLGSFYDLKPIYYLDNVVGNGTDNNTMVHQSTGSIISSDTNGTTTSKSSSGGCYIATCVYGSYDCPQVWTLRRYRDFTLTKTWHGRAFVHLYYAVSPTLVKWFGHTEWFQKFWKSKLDRMVSNLQKNGVENTAYQDIKW